MDFSTMFPKLQPWVEGLVRVWPAYIVKPQFAQWEVGHIVSLFVLLGCLTLINLRLLGAGLTSEPVSNIYKNLKWWLLAGVVGVVVTGILIGMANAERLYASTAFLVKMIGLAAAIIFTYLVTVPVAKADGQVNTVAKISAAVGLVLWAIAVAIFGSLKGAIAPGVLHIVFFAALMVTAATAGKLRWTFLGVLAVIGVLWQILTHTVVSPLKDAGTDKFNHINIAFSVIMIAWVVGTALYQIFKTKDKGEASGAVAQLTAYASILVWITVAAAGRWIAFA